MSGYSVTRLVRGKPSGEGQIAWNPQQPLAPESVAGFEAVIHLAGESVVGRWTEAKKRRILESRALGTRHLAEAVAKTSKRPRVLISASASGYYGNRNDEILRETSSSGAGFLPEVCREWEGATRAAAEAGIRTVHLRIGIMLSATGGALQKMLLPFRMGVVGNMGSGAQWWSWIHIQDLVGAVHLILKSDLIQGPVNAVSPRPVTNAEFTKALASVLGRPTIFPMPAFAARLAFGQMADELLLASQRVTPRKLADAGFTFKHPILEEALRHLLNK